MLELNFTYHRMQKLVAVVFVFCMTIIFLSGFDIIKAKARDIKRRADIKILTQSLNLYYDRYGKYPNSAEDWDGWDLSMSYGGGNAEFIKNLKEEGFIDREIKDPVNNEAYHYSYQKFNAGDYGCKKSFYILQVSNFELSSRDKGRGECPELDWADFAPNGFTVQDFD